MPRTAARAAPRAATRRTKTTTALDLLKDDHAQVDKLFKQFERFHKNDDEDGMRRCAEAACKALTVHAQIEEQIFYPALREAADAEDALDEADVEHSQIKELVSQIEGAEPGDDRYEARVTVLSEYVKHHVKEEESTIFAKARKSGVDLVALGERLQAMKQELGGGEMPAEIAALTGRGSRSRTGSRASH